MSGGGPTTAFGWRAPARPASDPPHALDPPTLPTGPPRARVRPAIGPARPAERPHPALGPPCAWPSGREGGPGGAGSAARTSGRWSVPAGASSSGASSSGAVPAIPDPAPAPAPATAPATALPWQPRRLFGARWQLTACSRPAGSRETRRRYEHPQCEGEGPGPEAVRAAWERGPGGRVRVLLRSPADHRASRPGRPRPPGAEK